MAYITLSKPGTEWGPCEGECEHRDCAATRENATKICRICDKPIGYENKFCGDDTPGELVHWLCLLEEIDRQAERRPTNS